MGSRHGVLLSAAWIIRLLMLLPLPLLLGLLLFALLHALLLTHCKHSMQSGSHLLVNRRLMLALFFP